MLLDYQLPERQTTASEAGEFHIQHLHHQQRCSTGLCSPPYSSPHTPHLHFEGPLCQAPEIRRCHWPYPGWG